MKPLKPCPFCLTEGEDRLIELWDTFDAGHIAHIHCTHCGADGPSVYGEAGADPTIALRGQLGAASGWIVKALKVLDTVDPDDTDEAERLAALVKAGEVLALATLARSKTPNARLTGPQRAAHRSDDEQGN